MVCAPIGAIGSTAGGDPGQPECAKAGASTRKNSSFGTETVFVSRTLYEQSLVTKGVPASLFKVFEAARRPSSNKQYRVYLAKWEVYCNQRQIDPIECELSEALEFLEMLRTDFGLSYSSLNTAALLYL